MSTLVGGTPPTPPEPYAVPADEETPVLAEQPLPDPPSAAARQPCTPARYPAARADAGRRRRARVPRPRSSPGDGDDDADPSRPLTRVRISHGDLRFARHHVLVGHYPGSTLVGGEGALDELLDGRLSRAAMLGIYPGPIETCQVFTDPEQWTPPAGRGRRRARPDRGAERGVAGARRPPTRSLTAALGHLTGGASAPSTEVQAG